MATHSSLLAWEIPWTEEPGGLQFMGSQKVGGVRRGVRASGSSQEGTGKSGSYGMWNHPRGHVWNVFVRPASS